MWDFAPGWRHQPGIKVPLLPGAISAESNLKNDAGSISQFSTSGTRTGHAATLGKRVCVVPELWRARAGPGVCLGHV
jgi:hypothetical protein